MAGTRETLVRRHFEAVRDLTWAQELEPKFRRHGVDGATLASYRDAWNRSAEKRDWAWWQEAVKGYTDNRLEDEITDCIEKMTAIGMRQWQQDRGMER
jgi:hypothetical protein